MSRRLDPKPLIGLTQFMAIVVLIKGALLPTFLFSVWNSIGLWRGMLSESQFLLEAILLGLFGGATWMLASPHRISDREAL